MAKKDAAWRKIKSLEILRKASRRWCCGLIRLKPNSLFIKDIITDTNLTPPMVWTPLQWSTEVAAAWCGGEIHRLGLINYTAHVKGDKAVWSWINSSNLNVPSSQRCAGCNATKRKESSIKCRQAPRTQITEHDAQQSLPQHQTNKVWGEWGIFHVTPKCSPVLFSISATHYTLLNTPDNDITRSSLPIWKNIVIKKKHLLCSSFSSTFRGGWQGLQRHLWAAELFFCQLFLGVSGFSL